MARAREETESPHVARPEGWDVELDTQRINKLTDGQLGGKMCDLRDEIQRSLDLRDIATTAAMKEDSVRIAPTIVMCTTL